MADCTHIAIEGSEYQRLYFRCNVLTRDCPPTKRTVCNALARDVNWNQCERSITGRQRRSDENPHCRHGQGDRSTLLETSRKVSTRLLGVLTHHDSASGWRGGLTNLGHEWSDVSSAQYWFRCLYPKANVGEAVDIPEKFWGSGVDISRKRQVWL